MANSKRRVHRAGELDALYFDKLPQRCKEVFFEYLEHSAMGETKNNAALFPTVYGFYIPEDCQSPIEQIMAFALNIICFEEESECKNPNPEFYQQEKISVCGKTYYADFFFDSDYPDNQYCAYRGVNHLKLVIECDGHDYHKTKDQVKHDNERDYNLKMEGYEVLHFSGSQIFNNPLQCAQDVYDYIQNKVGGWIKVKGD